MTTLQLQIGSGPFAFDVEAMPEVRLDPTWREAADPPELEALRTVWTFGGARIVSSDGTAEQLWVQWNAFADLWQRDGFPTDVKLVRDPGGDNVTVWNLGGSAYENLRLEALEVAQDEDNPAATWNVVMPVILQLSADRKFEDLDGIVGFDQDVLHDYDETGLQLVEWATEIRTKEGTDARVAAKAFGRIPLETAYGSSYTFLTNGPDGVSLSLLDPDERDAANLSSAAKTTARAPTRVVAVCRIQQHGIDVGTTGAGTSPSRVSLATETRTTADSVETTTIATAIGPNAESWVKSQKPLSVAESVIYVSPSKREANGIWLKRRPRRSTFSPNGYRWEITAAVSGGGKSFDFAPVMGGFKPVRMEGPLQPVQLLVAVLVTRIGGNGTNKDLPLPGLVWGSWYLDRLASDEGQVEVEQYADGLSGTKWRRSARLLYRADSFEGSPVDVIKALRESTPVPSYFL